MNQSDLIVRCLRCGQKNRISKDHLNDRSFCGRCGISLDDYFIQCLTCRTLNRIPDDRLYDLPLCGKCGSQLYDDFVTEVSESNFKSTVLDYPGIVLVCCFDPACTLCSRALPALKKLAPKFLGNIKIVRLNIPENHILSEKYKIRKTPAYLLFKNGIHMETEVVEGSGSIEKMESSLRKIVTRLENSKL
ncbi:MAG: thioredoxin domain-containing protein [Syntrophales bacterium]|jgi:thioredoxin 2|nr:thioredoxin domain-containing protein [Syntrophales bacterium]MDY0044926.1 thioredoxin domain-containing protein [Syntrophales bacterium]